MTRAILLLALVAIRRGPQVDYVGLVNREGIGEDRVTVAISARLLSIVRSSSGAVATRTTTTTATARSRSAST